MMILDLEHLDLQIEHQSRHKVISKKLDSLDFDPLRMFHITKVHF